MIKRRNRFLNALSKFLLFSAYIHFILLVSYTFYHMDFMSMNYFNILDLEFLFPSILEGLRMQILAGLIAVFIYVLFFFDFF